VNFVLDIQVSSASSRGNIDKIFVFKTQHTTYKKSFRSVSETKLCTHLDD